MTVANDIFDFTPKPTFQAVLPFEALPTPQTSGFTPIEQHGDIFLKRDDLYEFAGQRGGKVRTCRVLTLKAMAAGPRPSLMTRADAMLATESTAPFGVVTAGSRSSPQVNIVASVARELGIPCRVHTPGGSFTPEMSAAQVAGATVIQHMPGHNSVIVARARQEADLFGWHEIPFGMECDEAVFQTSLQVGNLPDDVDIKRLVVPVGSGMTLAGILAGLLRIGRTLPILAVQVGADPSHRLDKYALGWRHRVQLVKSDLPYHKPADTTTIGDVVLDPIYEAKCLPFLRPGDCLWVVGIRQTALEEKSISDPGRVQWKISGAWARHRLNCTLEGIQNVCGGMCCKSQTFWPPKAGDKNPDGCDWLGPEGCTLAPDDKPVTCHLYPLKLNGANLVAHFRMIQSKTHLHCGDNYGAGPMIIQTISGSLATLFGEDQAAKAVADVLAGGDAWVDVPQHIIDAVQRENEWAESNTVPQPRTLYLERVDG